MLLSQNEILHNSRSVLQQVPYRTTFERENFLFSSSTGPRLLVTLCHDIEFLNQEYDKATTDWARNAILEEMNKVSEKIKDLQSEFGTDVKQALEDAESDFWVEELARKAAIEALCQAVTTENMGKMLKLPAELYEETITKCQTFLNVINKTTRLAERKANIGNSQPTE